MLKAMLKARGCSVLSGQEMEFLSFIHETCPWFPEEGTVSPATWERVAQQLRDRFTAEGCSKFPIPTFVLWNLVKESFDPSPEVSRLPPPSSQGGLSQVLHNAVEGYEALKCSVTPSAPPVQDKQLSPHPHYGKELHDEEQKYYDFQNLQPPGL